MKGTPYEGREDEFDLGGGSSFTWIDVGSGHQVQVLNGGGVLWEHDTLPGYEVPRHQVSPHNSAKWAVVQREPLTLSPSLHCDPALGGCGAHGFIRDGKWVPA